MPMIPEAIVSMLACARIGAVHTVVFGGFSAEALRDRLNDGKCAVLMTADQGKRGSKTIKIKEIVDAALKEVSSIKNVLVAKRTGAEVPFQTGRDIWWHDALVYGSLSVLLQHDVLHRHIVKRSNNL